MKNQFNLHGYFEHGVITVVYSVQELDVKNQFNLHGYFEHGVITVVYSVQ